MPLPKRQAHLLAAQGVIAGLDVFYIMLLGIVLATTWGFVSLQAPLEHPWILMIASAAFVLLFAKGQHRWNELHHFSKIAATLVVSSMSFVLIITMYATGLIQQLAVPTDLFERTKHLTWVQEEKELLRAWSQWAMTMSVVAIVGSFSTLLFKPNTRIGLIAIIRGLTIWAAVGGLVIISFLLGRTQALILSVGV